MADSGSARLRPARPVVTVEGQASASLSEGLLELRIHESAEGLFACEATVGNWGTRGSQIGFLYFDLQVLDFGRDLSVSLGDTTLFQGRITGLEARFPEGQAPTLTVLAEDRHQDLRMTRRSRSFVDVSDADVMRRIASDHGLTPDVSVQGPVHKVLAQLNQSDLAFLRERARAVDAELWMDGSTLSVRSRGDRGETTVRLGYRNELREFTVLADLAGQRTSLSVNGWDVAAKQALTGSAEESLVSAELNGGRGGSSILSSAIGRRAEVVVHSVPLTGAEAQARAVTLYRRMARRFVHGSGVAETAGALRVGATVRLENLGDLFSGDYHVTEVTHLFDDASGLRTEFTVERPGIGAAAS